MDAPFRVNTLGSLHLLCSIDLLKKKDSGYNPRILICGSAEEYGLIKAEDLPLKEDLSVNPPSPYGISKAAVYYLANMFTRAYDMEIVYVRPFNHSGAGQKAGFFIPDMCEQIVKIERNNQEAVIKTGNLSSKRDISDVRDIVRAYRILLESSVSGVYNVCSGKSVQMSDVLDKLISLSEISIRHELDENRMRPSDIPELYGDNNKLKELGWEPEYSLEDTLESCLNSWRAV